MHFWFGFCFVLGLVGFFWLVFLVGFFLSQAGDAKSLDSIWGH